MREPLPEIAELCKAELEQQAQHIAAIENFIAQRNAELEVAQTDLEPGEPVTTEEPKSETPTPEINAIPEPKMPTKINLGHKSPFAPPGFIFTGIGKNISQRNYEKWVAKRFSEALAVSGQDEAGKVTASGAAAMRFLHTLVMITKAKMVHGEITLTYTGPKLPRPLDIPAAIWKVVEANRPILIALAPYFGLGSSLPTQPASETPVVLEEPIKLPEPEILDAAMRPIPNFA